MDPDLSWTCHACGEERPDAQIGVASIEGGMPRGGRLRITQRFCRDRVSCRVKARMLAALLYDAATIHLGRSDPPITRLS